MQGTGSLRLGAAFIAKFLPGRVSQTARRRRRAHAAGAQDVYISEPTWGNHKNIFGDEGLTWRTYRYFDAATVGLDFAGAPEADGLSRSET